MSAPSTTVPATILIVDDDERCRLLLTSLLSSEGYRLLTANSGQEAIAYAIAHRPDVVLLDVMMPDMDGFEVCRLLRSDRALTHLPIIFTTALDDKKSRLLGIEAGADDFVTKPIDILELRTRLRAITRLNRFRLLSEERARFEQVVSTSPDGIVITDGTGRVLMANRAFRCLAKAESECAYFFETLRAEDVTRIRHLLAKIDDSPQSLPPIEVELCQPAGIKLELTVAKLPWDGGHAFQFNVRDVTERKLIEAQLLRSQRVDLLGQLASGIIHDVNNIFSAIAARASLMSMGDDPAEGAKHLSAIETSAYHGGSLLRQLLMFARGKDAALVPLDSLSLLFEFHGMVQQALGKQISVALDTPGSVCGFVGDHHQVHQVLMNLCINARDAMPRGGCITLGLEQKIVTIADTPNLGADSIPGEYVVFSVRDNGTGIPDSVKARLFEPFFTTKAEGKGTGLGLATVQRVVKRHKGFVFVESTIGQGTTFRCYFPVAPVATGATRPGVPKEPAASGAA